MTTLVNHRRSWHVDAVQRKCKFCERTFVKTEHLSRHQRAHTGEKPYRCEICSKRFSRSDVLMRHQKGHGTASAASNSQFPDQAAAPAPEGAAVSQTTMQNTMNQFMQESVDPLIDFSSSMILRQTEPEPHFVVEPHAQQQPLINSPTNSILDRTQSGSQAFNWLVHGNWDVRLPKDVHLAGVNYDDRRLSSQSISSPHQSDSFRAEPLDPLANNILPAHEENGLYGQIPHEIDELTAGAHLGLANDAVSWFDQFNTTSTPFSNSPTFDPRISQSDPSLIRQPVSEQAEFLRRKPTAESTANGSNGTTRKHLQRSPRSSIGMPTLTSLWPSLCLNSDCNLFSDSDSVVAPIPPRNCGGSRRGLDQRCRDRLEKAFGIGFQSPMQNNKSGQTGADAEDLEESEVGLEGSQFPSAEILDTGLDLYFQHFHPNFPFIHTATFHPSSANPFILFPMCLIGLTLIRTASATSVVRKGFSEALKMAEIKLSKCRHEVEIDAKELTITIASSVLTLVVSVILEVSQVQPESAIVQRLYVQLLTLAQNQHLFAVTKTQSLPNSLYEGIQDLNNRWLAWSRIESLKRLLTCLLLCDSWFSGVQYTCPVLRTDNIQVTLPCDMSLFRAETSAKWLDLLEKGHEACMPVLSFGSRPTSLSKYSKPLSVLGMNGILCAIQLAISENYHRLLCNEDYEDSQMFVPWRAFAADPQAKITADLVASIAHSHGDILAEGNPHCMAQWHSMCIMLAADLRIFELGTGCAGKPAAIQALEKIAVWTQTPAARRAIIHAGQIFKLMTERRPSDGDTFHSSNALFFAALIMGLYIRMVPISEDDDNGPVYELLDDVDWKLVGKGGLTYEGGCSEDPASKFIRSGGEISFAGAVHHGGQQSAQRVLLDFCCLLDEACRWRIGHYTKVLRSMSSFAVSKDAF